jgi:hypothetical protein
MRDWPWSELDLDPTADRAEIKRAYAAKLKTLDRERDVQQFLRLRAAYELALSSCDSFAGEGPGVDRESTFRVDEQVSREEVLPVTTDVPCDFGRSVPAPPDATSRSLEQVTSRLVDAISNARDIASIEKVVDDCPDLLSLTAVDAVSKLLFQRLESRRLQPPVVDLLAARFGWRDVSRLRDWPTESIHRLQSWLGIHDLAMLKVPDVMSGHLRFARHKLKPPLTAWRAFVLSATTLGDSRLPVHALYRYLGVSKAEAMLPRDALWFVEAVETGKGDWRISLAAWIGGSIKWIAFGLILASFCHWLIDKQFPLPHEYVTYAHGLTLFVLLVGALKRSSTFFQDMSDNDLPFFHGSSWRGFGTRCLVYWTVWLPLALAI